MTLTLTEVFSGEVTRGRGLAAARMTPDLLARVEALTGMRAISGTLNLKLDRPFARADRWHLPANDLGADWEVETGLSAYHLCRIMIVGEIPGLAMQADEDGGYSGNKIEIVSPVHLRTTLGLEDGDRLRFVVVQ